jgi:hypothetical protein
VTSESYCTHGQLMKSGTGEQDFYRLNGTTRGGYYFAGLLRRTSHSVRLTFGFTRTIPEVLSELCTA